MAQATNCDTYPYCMVSQSETAIPEGATWQDINYCKRNNCDMIE